MITILGAGITGLSCAYHLKKPYIVLEKESSIGGLCRSYKKDGYTFDYSGHYLHFRNNKVKKFIEKELKVPLMKIKKKAFIYMNDKSYNYPIQRQGKEKTKEFKQKYTKKTLGVEESELVKDWNKPFLPKGNKSYNDYYYYPKEGGIQAIVNALAKNVNVKTKQNIETRQFDTLVSTIPLPELLKLIPNLPEDVKEAASKLRWASMTCFNKPCEGSGYSWCYYPDIDFDFFRVGNYPNGGIYFDSANAKDGIKIRYAYVIYDINREQAVKTIMTYLNKNNIYSIGRYGAWEYSFMEKNIEDGKRLAMELNKC